MCTSITLQNNQGENFFGRTMDFSYDIEPGIFVIPRNYRWQSLVTPKTYVDRYSFISIGQELDGILAFFDGVNEKGFAAAVLFFAGYADYNLPTDNKEKIANLDFLHFMLGRCACIDDLRKLVHNVSIVGFIDPITNTAAPLHWIATDSSGECVVIEQTSRGLEIIDNPIGVMANSPDFNWHLTNLRNYINASPDQLDMAQWDKVTLRPFGQGGGSMALPCGYTSPERFVRCSFLKSHIQTPRNTYEGIMSCFHIMNSVTIPKGIILTNKGTYDYTLYTAFINTNTCEYFFKTYENKRIITVCLWDYLGYGSHPLYLGSLVRPPSFEIFS
jgi:penicillin V acylase-like amidase (Ntn superfamily)